MRAKRRLSLFLVCSTYKVGTNIEPAYTSFNFRKLQLDQVMRLLGTR